MDATRVLRRRVVAHLVECPAEIDGGRARCTQELIGLDRVLTSGGRQRDPVRGGDADRGCAAHDHRPDRLGDLGGRAALDVDLLERKPPLVEEDDAILLEAKDPLRLEHSRRPAREPAATGRTRSGQW